MALLLIFLTISDDSDSASFKYKQKITGQAENNGIKDVPIIVPLRYLSNFLRTLEMPLINSGKFFFFTWSDRSIIVTRNYGNRVPKFQVTNTKLYIPVVTLSAQDNEKLV